MKKLLSMSGGGTKIAGLLGAVEVICPEHKFDTIVGVSAGAIMTPLVAAEQLGFNGLGTARSFVLEGMNATSFLGDDLHGKLFPLSLKALWRLLTGAPGMTDMSPLADKLHLALEPIWGYLQKGPKMYAAAIDIHSGERSIRLLNQLPLEGAIQAIIASASIPVFTVPVEDHVDGGIRDHSAAAHLIPGHTEVFSVFTRPSEGVVFRAIEKPNAVKILMRTIDIMAAEISVSDEQTERAICKDSDIIYKAFHMPSVMESVYDTDQDRLQLLYALAKIYAKQSL